MKTKNTNTTYKAVFRDTNLNCHHIDGTDFPETLDHIKKVLRATGTQGEVNLVAKGVFHYVYLDGTKFMGYFWPEEWGVCMELYR